MWPMTQARGVPPPGPSLCSQRVNRDSLDGSYVNHFALQKQIHCSSSAAHHLDEPQRVPKEDLETTVTVRALLSLLFLHHSEQFDLFKRSTSSRPLLRQPKVKKPTRAPLCPRFSHRQNPATSSFSVHHPVRARRRMEEKAARKPPTEL